jgi:hypothetical protein
VRELLERHVDSGFVPGVVAVLARQGEVHIEAMGNLAFEDADGGRHDLSHGLDDQADRRRVCDDARRGLHPSPR